MWEKFREADEEGARQASVAEQVTGLLLTPTPLEATISECSLEVKGSDIFTPKLKSRLRSCCCLLLVLIIPLLVFVLLLEWRRFQLTGYYDTFVAREGSFHLANTACGPVQGMVKDGGFEFLGIPYAVPPIPNQNSKSTNKKIRETNYMWEPGTKPFRLEHCWKDVLPYPAEKKPDECLQIRSSANGTYETLGSPDCLTLDIYTPFIGYDNPSPVIVVIALPTLMGGWPDESHKDQATPTPGLAKEKGVVFVVPRFRLGPLGFLPRLLLNDTSSIIKNSKDFHDSVIQTQKTQLKMDRSYNLGLTDLTAALMWISTNIEHFGGDPSLVTLLGWGAGADLVTSLTATRPPKGHPFLFTQAWVSHNTLTRMEEKLNGTFNRTSGFRAGMELWANSPCNRNQSAYDPLCLMALSPRELVESVPRHWLSGSGHLWLENDNFHYRQPPTTVWAKGQPPNDFPLVLGSTVHGTADTLTDCQAIESQVEEDVKLLLKSESPDMVGKIQNASDLQTKLAMVSDSQMTCPLWKLARKADGTFSSGVYFYLVSFLESVPCANGSRLRLSGGLADISVILGRYKPTSKAASQFAVQLQDLFYEFVVDGALPGKVRANQGYYDLGQKIETRPNYPRCSAWE